jgi:hypothetical protein
MIGSKYDFKIRKEKREQVSAECVKRDKVGWRWARTECHRRRLAFAPVAALNVRLDEAEHGRRRLDDAVADRGGNVGQAAPGDDGLGRVVVGVLRLRWGRGSNERVE